MSNISILFPLCEENDSGNVFVAFIAESYGWAIHQGVLFYGNVIKHSSEWQYLMI